MEGLGGWSRWWGKRGLGGGAIQSCKQTRLSKLESEGLVWRQGCIKLTSICALEFFFATSAN